MRRSKGTSFFLASIYFLVILVFLAFLITLNGCTLTVPTPVVPVATPVPSPNPSPSVTPVAGGSLDDVRNLAIASKCAKYSFGGGQGLAPKGYLKGVALTYAKAICHRSVDSVIVASQAVGDASKDALAHYASILSANGMKTDTPEARLRHTFALMVGSASRESSWRWCVGKDPGATNTSAETCETGLYQTSYNSRSASPVLPILFARFKSSSAGCFASDYKGTTTCSADNMKNWGTGEGVVFQDLTKQCPGFASEYHAVMLRTQRTHYGPINQKVAELRPECDSMFLDIEQLILTKPGICGIL